MRVAIAFLLGLALGAGAITLKDITKVTAKAVRVVSQ